MEIRPSNRKVLIILIACPGICCQVFGDRRSTDPEVTGEDMFQQSTGRPLTNPSNHWILCARWIHWVSGTSQTSLRLPERRLRRRSCPSKNESKIDSDPGFGTRAATNAGAWRSQAQGIYEEHDGRHVFARWRGGLQNATVFCGLVFLVVQ